MTTDSFFTSRNSFDHQVSKFQPVVCEEVMEAAARRLVSTTGPHKAAQRIQRLADICAGSFISAELEAIILGAGKPKPATPEPKKPGWGKRVWMFLVGNPGVVFWTGVSVGLWIGAR